MCGSGKTPQKFDARYRTRAERSQSNCAVGSSSVPSHRSKRASDISPVRTARETARSRARPTPHKEDTPKRSKNLNLRKKPFTFRGGIYDDTNEDTTGHVFAGVAEQSGYGPAASRR